MLVVKHYIMMKIKHTHARTHTKQTTLQHLSYADRQLLNTYHMQTDNYHMQVPSVA